MSWIPIPGLLIRKNSGSPVTQRPRLNLIEGSNVTITVADDSGDEETDVTIAASGGGGGGSGGQDLAVGKPLATGNAPSGSYPNYAVNRLRSSDSDWAGTDGHLLTSRYGGHAEDFSRGFIGLLGTGGTETYRLDLEAASSGTTMRMWGQHGASGIYRPVGALLERSDDDSAWTTVKDWGSSLTDGGQPGSRLWMIEADISSAGSHRYWRFTLTRRAAASTWIFAGRIEFIT